MPIEEMARTDVVTASPDTTAETLAGMMDEDSVGSVVIVGDGGPLGIVTDRDIALEVAAAGADPTAVTATDVMHEDLFTVEAEEGIYDVLEEMRAVGVRRVPVVDDGGLVGIVTLDDLVVLLASEFDNVADVIQAGAPPY